MTTTITDMNGTRTVRHLSDRVRDAGLIRHPSGQGHWIAPNGWDESSLPDDVLIFDEALIPIGSEAIPDDYRVAGPYDRNGMRSYCYCVKVTEIMPA
jgi:hypothetical protein